MRDGAGRRALKRAALLVFRAELALSRFLKRRRGGVPHLLAGACRRSGMCCEAPSIQVGWAVFHLPLLRRAFLAWQWRVNGFASAGEQARQRVLVFHCTHFDRASRECDSYDSRPGICRDYPRVQLEQPFPEFLPGCGYRARPRNAEALARALAASGAPAAQRERVRDALGLAPEDEA